MDDIKDNALDVSISLIVVKVVKEGKTLAVVHVGFEGVEYFFLRFFYALLIFGS
jgi:hypothetical protein